MKSRKLFFDGAGGAQLAARLDSPVDGKPLAYALFAHCFTCNKNLRAVGNISRALTQQGVAVLRFDFTGLGESEGDFADTNFSSNVEDLQAAAEFMRREWQAPQLLVGHSLGGAAVLQAASRIPSVKAVATIGAPCNPVHVKHILQSSIEEIEAEGVARVSIAGRPFTIKKQFLDDLSDVAMKEVIRDTRASINVLHAPLDDTVGIDQAGEIFMAARHPKSFVSLDKADHLLSREEDSLYAGRVIAALASRYIDLPAAGDKVQPKDKTVTARTGVEGFLTEIRANGHSLTADEPASVGGTDLGPTPYELLASSLAACTSMTLRMYADHKKLPLRAAEVEVIHSKEHADDCEQDVAAGNAKIDVFRRTVKLEGELSEEQRRRMLEIADRCPVHKTLHSAVRVQTNLKE